LHLNFGFAKLLDALWHHESKRMIGHKSIGCPTQKKSYCWKEFDCFSRSTKKQQVYMHTVFWSSLLSSHLIFLQQCFPVAHLHKGLRCSVRKRYPVVQVSKPDDSTSWRTYRLMNKQKI
jgi:hypothetical protein